MKKLLLMLFCLSALFSCQKEEGSSVVGTKWHADYGGGAIMVLEFSSSNTVVGYFADKNGLYKTGKTTGGYSVSNNKLTFTNMTIWWYDNASYKPETAEISGGLLTVKGKSIFNTGDKFNWNETFIKQ